VADPCGAYGDFVMSGFNTQRYTIVQRTVVVSVLQRHGLSMRDVCADPTILRRRNVRGLLAMS